MITLKDWLQAIEYKITEGGVYGWHCYGPNAYCLDYWDQKHEGVSSSITFSRENQTVFECYVCDYGKKNYYRWVHPKYRSANIKEGEERGLDSNIVFDNDHFTLLESVEEFLDKLETIYNGF